ncbi:MAG: hypothetical protein KXJ53_15940 [Phenylobacterium sp.]|jgi:hypothetical protein|nr:hypothetical protein [Phenylobacterium sp.]
MKTFFLSAGVPMRERDPRYYETADNVAIRESLRGLIGAILPQCRIIFGGQPAITPMFRLIARELNLDVRNHVVLYQSKFFRKEFPPDNAAFERVELTADLGEREASLSAMRAAMFDNNFDGAVFIGGMEGIELEWELFRAKHPSVPCFPIATTGAAARIIFDREGNLPPDLATEFAYLHLFRKHLLGAGA